MKGFFKAMRQRWLLVLGRKSAPERLAIFLCFLAEHIDPENSNAPNARILFELPLKRSEIADFLGLTIETVSRQITKLRQKGVIILHDNRHIEIPDLAKLRALAEQGA